MKNKGIYTALPAFLMLLPIIVSAQNNAGTIPLGSFVLTPSIEVGVARDDNLFLEERSQVETTLTSVKPAMSVVYDNGVSGVAVNYSADAGYYSDQSSENYVDHSLDLTVGTTITDVQRIELNAEFLKSHDSRTQDSISGGPSISDPNTADLDEYDEKIYGLTYQLGFVDSPVSIDIDLMETQREYTTNRITTSDFDRDETLAEVGLFWSFADGLKLGVGYGRTEIEYVNGGFQALERDGDEKTISVELEYNPSTVLLTNISLGETERTVDSDGMSTENDFWNIDVSWSFLSYSTISLLASNTFADASSRAGSITSRQNTGVSWNHRWTGRFASEISYNMEETDYIDENRVDDDETVLLGIDYQFRRWLNIGLSYQSSSRDSSGGNLIEDYDQNIYGLNILMTL